MNNPNAEHRIVKLQAWSALGFATFLSLHLLNTMSAAAGPAVYNGWLQRVRLFYHQPLVEFGLVAGCGVLHIGVSLLRAWQRRQLRKLGHVPQASLRLRLHRWTGCFLLLVIVGHVAATRLIPARHGVPVDVTFLTFSLQTWPWFFYPYYLLLGFSGFYHLSHGLPVAVCRCCGVELPHWVFHARSKRFWAWIGVGAGAIVLGILGMGAVTYPVDTSRFPEYRTLFEAMMPSFLLPWK